MTASVSDVLVAVVCFFCCYKICVLSKSRTKYGGEFGYSQFFRRIFAGQKIGSEFGCRRRLGCLYMEPFSCLDTLFFSFTN